MRGVDTRLLPNKFIPDPDILAPVAGASVERDLCSIDPDVLDSIWPIHLVDANDKEQEHVLFALLGRLPQVIAWYLENHVLPLTMRFQPLKLSASGQELGSDLIFGSRLGFSGTPSDLLPVEFGSCVFEEGDDGKILSTLTSPEVVAAFFAADQPVALSIYEWSGRYNQEVLLDWTLIDSQETLLQAAQEVAASKRSHNDFPTAMGYALGFGARMLERAPQCLRKTLDMAGDGQNNEGFGPKAAYREFPFADVTVNGLVVNAADY